MNRSYLRAITIAIITSLLGGGIDYLFKMEEALGLDTLFKIRGTRPPPAEIVIVAIDEKSEAQLHQGNDITRWRAFHGKLIQALQRQGAALIVFDLQFIASHPNHDPQLAKAMQQAGNVLLVQCVQKLDSSANEFSGRKECSDDNNRLFVRQKKGTNPTSAKLVSMRRVPITPLLSLSALDHAPFYLANDAANTLIREGWLFLDALAEAPSLPLVAWLYYLQHSGALPDTTQAKTTFSAWLTEQRRHCAPTANKPFRHSGKKTAHQPFIEAVLCSHDSRYLDFYGPPKTLRMVSYSDVYNGKVTNLKGKVVFVGKANRQYPEDRRLGDYFQTPYTSTQSGPIAGIEIMATQFGNLLEQRFITPLCPHTLWYVLFGVLIGLLLGQFSGFSGLMACFWLFGMYYTAAVGLFYFTGIWLPVAAPLIIQIPIACIISLLWSRRDLLQERKRILVFIHQLFPQWLHLVPSLPGHWYPENNLPGQTADREVNGLCLSTDIEGYTKLASSYSPLKMWELLRAYYQVLGQPVRTYSGIIANIQGDEMMAMWIDAPAETQRQAACLAALEIAKAVDRFNEKSIIDRLPTRIGLHEGDMILASGIAGGFRYYNPFGDTPAIASRIQGVNRHLGTRILASAQFAASMSQIISRPVGIFRLRGRQAPLALLEIVGTGNDVSTEQYKIYQKFAIGLAAFQQGDWDNAIINFQTLLSAYGTDGPSEYYLQLALHYHRNPPTDWDGVVSILSV